MYWDELRTAMSHAGGSMLSRRAAVMRDDISLRPAGTNRYVQRHQRILFSVPITFRYMMAGVLRTSQGISLDISEGGLGALVKSGLRIGETVKIDLPLPGAMLSTVAIVRHTSSGRSGFEFLGLTAEERSRITSVIGAS
jgi:c-di-GMP-binding flagellar brake protein YcgR